ncbi:DUF1080 domain-containing protein [Olivibacter sp. SDN3]|uniref:sialate O-acetylesterase n=1 Tax=Olivibacter sp. SDN3 TaxID=2764720 RepID=UPI0016515959|nr:sialate O-acetylesterase [Olivibacter sp. SDN3]QNL49218.1 DUF1080 domain-containing protein [Olivibacter sp. SDN3]
MKKVSYIYIFLTLMTSVFLLKAQNIKHQDSSYHIYLLLGQSNMAGRGEVTTYYRSQVHSRVLMLNKNNDWVKASHPLHFDKPEVAGVGLGLRFGVEMAKAYPENIIGLVPCAVGGTSITKWRPNAYDDVTNTHPYDDAVLRIKEAMKAGTIKGILWHQGEGDSQSGSDTYLENLAILIERLRDVVGNPELPFVVGELGKYRADYLNINKVLVDLPKKVPHTYLVSSEGLWHKGDGTHFDSPSASTFGKRFAEAMLKVQHQVINNRKTVKGRCNRLTAKEKADGWELLFDGVDPSIRWRSVNGDDFPQEGWTIEKESLKILPGGRGKDIISREEFSDFELTLDFKLTKSANSGVKYFVNELQSAKSNKIVFNGPEFQIIDDFNHPEVKSDQDGKGSTGALYLIYAPEDKELKAVGKWNTMRIVSNGGSVEHWLNGKKVVDYKLGSEEFRNLIETTKFKEYRNYGETASGHLILQDHNDAVFFRNIKVRRLK